MLTIGIILLYISGWLLIRAVYRDASWMETVGFAFPIGLFVTTLLMWLADWMGLRLTPVLLLSLNVLMTVAGGWVCRHQLQRSLKEYRFHFTLNLNNLLWLLLLALVIYAEASNFLKTVYFPVYDRDSLAGFDTIGFIAAQEHTYRGMSIFDGDYMPQIHQAGSYISYMPMLQLSYAYVYIVGAATSKLVPALFFAGFMLGFYGLMRRVTCATASIVGVLGMLMTPEMLSFSSLSNTNVVHACLASAGLLYVCQWYQSHRFEQLMLGCLLLAANCWMRAEGIIFVATALVLVALRGYGQFRQLGRKGIEWKLLLLPLAALLPTLLFQVYAQVEGLTSESILITRPFWDAVKFGDMCSGAWFLSITSTYYGWTFHLFLLVVVLNFILFKKGKATLHVAGALLLAFVLYFVLLYHINYIWDTLDHVMNFSAKRFLFCYVPIAWYYIVSNGIVGQLFHQLESHINFRRTEV